MYKLFVRNQKINKNFVELGESESWNDVANTAFNLPKIYESFIYSTNDLASYSIGGSFICSGFASKLG